MAEEVLTNIATHGHAGEGGSEARLEVGLLRGAIQLRFEDDGLAFDPLAQPDPDLDARPAGAGGRGLLLIKRLVESCAYAREGGINLLTARFRRPPVPEGSPGTRVDGAP